MQPLLLTIAWLIGVIYSSIPLYWMAVHPLARFWQGRRYSPARWLVPAWLAANGMLVAITFPWRLARWYSTLWALLPGVLLLGCGFALYFLAMRGFHHAQVTGEAEYRPAQHEQTLVTTGIRARVRHPIYLGHLCNLTGITVASGLLALYVLLAFSMVMGALMIRLEDRELAERFGAAYEDYRRRVPMLIPRRGPRLM